MEPAGSETIGASWLGIVALPEIANDQGIIWKARLRPDWYTRKSCVMRCENILPDNLAQMSDAKMTLKLDR